MEVQYYKRVNSDSQSIKTEIVMLKGNLATTIKQTKPKYNGGGYHQTNFIKYMDEAVPSNYAVILIKTGSKETTAAEFELFTEKMN